ncbi:MAG: CHAT domain-containing protein [Pirellulaceae bacterium]|nr:CHAT domain-containing protein [Pirellulaceae bacterium]
MKQNQASRLFACIGLWSLTWLSISPASGAQETAIEPPTTTPAENSDSVWKQLGLPEPNPNAPYAKPPQLKLLFEDDFSNDVRGDYQIGGKQGAVKWERGRLLLHDGAQLSLELGAENWVEFDINIQFPQLTDDGQKNQFKVFLDLGPATKSYLVLRQERRDGQTSSELVSYELPIATPGQSSLSLPKMVRTVRQEGPLISGAWKIVYYTGVWMVEAPNHSSTWLAGKYLGHSRILKSQITTTGGPMSLKRLNIQVVPQASPSLNSDQAANVRIASAKSREVFAMWEKQDSAAAFALAKEVIAIRHEVLGRFHFDTNQSVVDLAAVLSSLGRISLAESLLEESLASAHLHFPYEHPEIAKSLNNLAFLRTKSGREADAEVLLAESLAVRKRLFGADHQDVALGCNNLAALLYSLGRTNEAEKLYAEAIEIYRHAFGRDDPDLALAICNLATCLEAQGRADEAELRSAEALAMYRRVDPADSLGFADTLHVHGSILVSMGRLAEAELFLEEALDMQKRLFRGDHSNVAKCLASLASLYYELGRSSEAELLLEESLAMMNRFNDKDHSEIARIITNLAVVRQSLGRDFETELLLRESLAINRRLYLGDHPSTASTLANMASLNRSLGRTSDAEILFREALSMRRRLFPGDHADVASVLQNLASLLCELGKTDEVESLVTEALAINRRLYLIDHPQMALGLHAAACVRRRLQQVAAAETLFRESLAMQKRLFPGDHPRVASTLNDLAYTISSVGQLHEAVDLYQESLASIDRMRRQVRGDVLDFTAYSDELSLRKTAQRFAAVLTNLNKASSAIGVLERGNNRVALDLFGGGRRAAERAFRVTGSSDSIARYDSAISVEAAARAELLESEIRMSRAEDEDKQVWSEQVAAARTKLSESTAKVFDELRDLIPQMDPLTGEEVLSQLRDGQGLIAWVWAGNGPVLLVARDHQVFGFRLANSEDATSSLADMLTILRTWTSVRPNNASVSNEILINKVREEILPAAAREKLLGLKSLIAVPDGPVQGIPLEFFLPDMPFTYAPSATIALYLQRATEENNQSGTNAIVLGDPLFFNVTNDASTLDRSGDAFSAHVSAVEQVRLYGKSLTPLPGTRLEGMVVASLLGADANLLLGADATAPKLNEAIESNPPRVLHLATHGLMGSSERPLLASLALTTPAEPTLGDTGFVTLEDILSTWGARLKGTELVVLSACDTARGVQKGDTSMALPLGLFVCGAETVIASQWKVDDTATALLMSRFYANWLGKTDSERVIDGVTFAPGQSLSKLAALREAQAWLRGLNSEQVATITAAMSGTDGAKAVTQFTRGGDDELADANGSDFPFAHPFYWSAFVLYGSPE